MLPQNPKTPKPRITKPVLKQRTNINKININGEMRWFTTEITTDLHYMEKWLSGSIFYALYPFRATGPARDSSVCILDVQLLITFTKMAAPPAVAIAIIPKFYWFSLVFGLDDAEDCFDYDSVLNIRKALHHKI